MWPSLDLINQYNYDFISLRNSKQYLLVWNYLTRRIDKFTATDNCLCNAVNDKIIQNYSLLYSLFDFETSILCKNQKLI